MNIDETKNEYSVKSQYITIDMKGNILSSCDTLFDMPCYSCSNASKKIPFLKPIVQSLAKQVKKPSHYFSLT